MQIIVYKWKYNSDPVPISFNQNFSYKPLAKPYHGIYKIRAYSVFNSLEMKTGSNRQPVYNMPSYNQSMLWTVFTRDWGNRDSCLQPCLSGSGEAAAMNHPPPPRENKGLVANELNGKFADLGFLRSKILFHRSQHQRTEKREESAAP